MVRNSIARLSIGLLIGASSLAATGSVAPGFAAQSLIPTPYPSAVPGAAPLDPEPHDVTGPQTIMRDPYPQLLGDSAQGNPPIARHHRRQHLVPSIYQRKYRVDRHGGAQP